MWWSVKKKKEHREKEQRGKVKVYEKSLFTKKHAIIKITDKKFKGKVKGKKENES